MSNSKNRPLAATRNRPTSPKRRAYEQIYCIIFGDSLQETGCYFYTLFLKGMIKMPTARKLPSGSWRCQVYSHSVPVFNSDGSIALDSKSEPKMKRIYESFTSDDQTKRGKAEAEMMALEFALNKKRRNSSRDLTLLEAIDNYIKIKEPVLSKATVSGYIKIRKYAFQNLMATKLKDIDTDVLITAVSLESARKTAQKGKDGIISPKTVRNEFGLLTAVLNYYDVDYNEKKITLPQIPNKKFSLPDPEEVFRAVKGTDIELPVLLAMWLSFTASEIAGLTKSESLLDDGKYIAINEVVLTIDGKEYKKDTGKQPKRQRVLKLPEYIKELIDDVYTDRIVPMPANTIYRKLKRYLAKAGVNPITFHQLRHVNASVMHMLNVPDIYAQDRGGWATNHIMHKNYTHAFTKERMAVDNTIDNYFADIMQHEMQHDI